MGERRFPRWARWTAAGCGVAVLAASSYLVVDALPSEAASNGMRVATVSTGSVTQSISLSGSVQRVDQVSATFRTPGTVRTVKVSVGDEVEAGDVLATMDTDDLERAVTVAQANLVAAQASLDAAAADTGSTSASTASAASTVRSTTSSPSQSPSPRASSAPAPRVDTAPVHRAVADVDALVKTAVTTCQPVLDSGTPTPPPTPPTPTPSPSPTSSASPSPSPSPSGTPTVSPSSSPSPSPSATTTPPPTTDTPTPEQVSACIGALSRALGAAQHTASAMAGLTKALDAAAKALQQQQSNAATPGATGQTSGTGAAAGPGAATGTAPTGGSGGARSTADLEVAVLEATQQLAGAEQDLDAAVLAAPISGRVGQVDLRKGEQASTSSAVVLVGPGAAVVTVDLPLAQLSKVRVAQDVSVTPAGTTEQVPGLVRSIGVLPSSTTTSTPAYPVQVTVSDAPVTLAAGSNATTAITLATVSDVLTVPVSAVTGVSSGSGSVRVLAGGTTTTAAITVGAVGQGRVQVENGLTAGQVVVLADPTTALPTSTGFRRPTTGGVTGLTGRGGPGGGLGGPPPG